MAETKPATKIDDTYVVITLMVAAQVLNESLDELQGTPFYKQALKQSANRFQTILEKDCNRTIQELYATDDHTMMALQEGIYEIARKLATVHPTTIQAVRDCIAQIPDPHEKTIDQ